MSIRVPKFVLIAVALLAVVVGAGLGGYFLFIAGEDCVSRSTGDPVSCDSDDAVTEEEYTQLQAEEEKERQAGLQRAEECEEQFEGLLSELEELNSRLSVGLSYDDYSSHVGDIRVAYDRANFEAVEADCLGDVGIPAEEALNAYARAGSVWNDCISDFDCDTDSIDPELQRRWNSATDKIDEAQRGLEALGQP